MTSSHNHGFRPATTPSGAAVRRRRHIGDRQSTARRLLFAGVAEAAYDPDLDIDWDAPPDPALNWLPPERVSLYGSRLWERLSPEQRRELGKHELVSMLSVGIYAQSMLSMLMFRDVIESRDPVDDHTRFTLAAIHDESRNSTMYSRLINATGLPPYRLPAPQHALTKLTLWIPDGPTALGFRLLIQEMAAQLLRELTTDPHIQPHLRQLALLHAASSARHVEATRAELLRAIDSRGPIRAALHRWALRAVAAVAYAALVHPAVYRAVGVHPIAGATAALTTGAYRRNARAATATVRDFLRETHGTPGVRSIRNRRAVR
ncbi:diiron oxygenase [Nocardia amikacinitolerans]|uniref:diiron oxygenase n=1 Tax=Nocardia amikacinitolerans TaxID=756689 RepID=UPI0020A60272|nr:diiron oxygenase [Nocardia amikacinitolerans]MCP2291554.1 P-aminobenzoate N-oxygenase AurF [Nocardia amikacinitolerans]